MWELLSNLPQSVGTLIVVKLVKLVKDGRYAKHWNLK